MDVPRIELPDQETWTDAMQAFAAAIATAVLASRAAKTAKSYTALMDHAAGFVSSRFKALLGNRPKNTPLTWEDMRLMAENVFRECVRLTELEECP